MVAVADEPLNGSTEVVHMLVCLLTLRLFSWRGDIKVYTGLILLTLAHCCCAVQPVAPERVMRAWEGGGLMTTIVVGLEVRGSGCMM